MLTFKETAQWLQDRDNFLIITHRSPDGDTVGSGVGLCLALREQGKTAFLIENEGIHGFFSSYVENLSSPDFIPDYIVAVDTATEDLFPDSGEPYKGKVDLSIDHHPPRSMYAKENCIYPEHAAAGELIFHIASLLGAVSKQVAHALYLALSTDTGCFVYGNTTAETHRIASILMETGIEVRDVNKEMFQTTTLTRLKLESLLISNMHLYNNGTIAIVCVTQKMLEDLHATDHDTENISAFIAKVEGVVTGVTIQEKKDGICKLSVRSNPNILKANEVCAQLGGGGHAAASGAKFKGTMDETVSAIVKAIEFISGSSLLPFEHL